MLGPLPFSHLLMSVALTTLDYQHSFSMARQAFVFGPEKEKGRKEIRKGKGFIDYRLGLRMEFCLLQ
jgi:hypothetical protein